MTDAPNSASRHDNPALQRTSGAPWWSISAFASAAIVLAAAITAAVSDNDGYSVASDGFWDRFMVFANTLRDAPVAFAIVALLVERPTSRTLAFAALAAWGISLVVSGYAQQDLLGTIN